MSQTIKCLCAALLVVCLFAFTCALAEGSYYMQLPTEGTAASLNVTLAIPAENPVVQGVNPLTGEAWSGNYTPILCNIDTHPDGWPHWGVSSADITYELPLQGDGSTRSVALFMGDVPAFAGPVRSGRVPMGSIREMWDSAWVFFGWQNSGNPNRPDYTVDLDDWALRLHADARQHGRWVFPFVEGTERNYDTLFHRVSDSNHIAPHNVQVDLHAVAALFTRQSVLHPFIFTDTGLDHGADVSHIRIEHKTTTPAYVSEYYYNNVTGLYDRYRNDQQDYDALNGMPLSYANVIVLRTDVSWYNNNPSRPVVQLVGQGTAEIFQNGKYIRGYWTRAKGQGAADALDPQTLASRMVFYDDYGQELPMKVGKTFIQVVDDQQAVIVDSMQQIAGGGTLATPKPTPTPAPTRTPRPTRTPKADATVEPVEQVEDVDQEFTFGG